MNYRDYKTARDAAWQTLIRFKANELPVRISDGIRQMGISLEPYSESEAFLIQLGLAALMRETDGLSVRLQGKYYLFYRGDMTPGRIRFTVAHELGHIVLGHLEGQTHTTRNREPQKDDAPIEQMANVFASRLLAPTCVLHELNVYTPERIAKLCDISLAAARFRAERMELLRNAMPLGRRRWSGKYRSSFGIISNLNVRVRAGRRARTICPVRSTTRRAFLLLFAGSYGIVSLAIPATRKAGVPWTGGSFLSPDLRKGGLPNGFIR